MVTTTSQKFVDQHTKWKEIFLIKEKTQTVDYLELFNKGLVIPTGVGLDRLKADKGTEFTSSAFKQYCSDTAIKLEFASPNTPQQIGANERAGMTFVGIMRCLLADSGLPKFLWGELMLTAVYLRNRAPHAALVNATRRQVYFTNGEFPDIAHKDDPVSFVEYTASRSHNRTCLGRFRKP